MRRPVKAKSGLSDLSKFVIAAIMVGGSSFGAVYFGLPELLGDLSNGPRPGVSANVASTGALNQGVNAPGVRAPALSTPSPGASGLSAPAGNAMTEAHVRRVALQLMGKEPTSLVKLELKGGRMQAMIGDARLRLEPPAGHCFLDSSHQADARLNEVLQRIFSTDIRLVGGFADCEQLRAWRAGERKTLRDYGKFLTPLAMLDKRAEGSPKQLMAAMCQTMRNEGGEFPFKDGRNLKARFEQLVGQAKINESRPLGVITQDDNACYFAMVQKLQTENGEVKTQIDVSAAAIISGKMIYSNLYAALESDGTLKELLDRQKANIARNVAVSGK